MPIALDALMLAKNPDARPTAEQVYTSLVPLVSDQPTQTVGGDRDPTRPFRTPLLAPPVRRDVVGTGPPLTEDEFERIRVEVAALMDAGNRGEAVRLLESGLQRSRTDSYAALELRRLLGLTLFYVGEYRRAAGLLGATGAEFRDRGLPPTHQVVVDCAYHAGHAYAEIGDTARAMSHLRFYLQHLDADDPDETERALQSRFVIAQMLALDDRHDEALAELRSILPAFRTRYGPGSAHVRNLERQITRLRLP